MIEAVKERILAPPGKVQKKPDRLDELPTFNCDLENSEQEKTWVSKAEWEEYGDEQSQKAKRTTRIELDDELKFCKIEERQGKITDAFETRQEDLKKSRMLFIKQDENGGVNIR